MDQIRDGGTGYYAPDPGARYRTAQAVSPHIGIDVTDAILNLQSFGHSCVWRQAAACRSS